MADLALFDLDYTLTRKGTWGRFIAASMKGRGVAILPLALHAAWAQLRYKLGHIPRIRVKQAMMSHAIVGWPDQQLLALAEEFARAEVPDKLDARVLAALKAHQAAGDVVIIASAAVDILVAPIARHLNVEHFVATDMAWTEGSNRSADGDVEKTLAPHFSSPNCYGTEKLARIQNLLESLRQTGQIDKDFGHITAYSDSRADAPMLEMADRAIIVRPKAKTRRYANAKGFEIWDA